MNFLKIFLQAHIHSFIAHAHCSHSFIYDSRTPSYEITSLLFCPILPILSNCIEMFILFLVYSIHYVYYKSIVKFVYFVYCMLVFFFKLWFFVFHLCLGCFLLFMWVSFGFVVCPWSIVPENLFWKNIFQSWCIQLQPWIKNHFQGWS
jgi:hypothetical protein